MTTISLANDCDRDVRDGGGVTTVNAGKKFYESLISLVISESNITSPYHYLRHT